MISGIWCGQLEVEKAAVIWLYSDGYYLMTVSFSEGPTVALAGESLSLSFSPVAQEDEDTLASYISLTPARTRSWTRASFRTPCPVISSI